MERPLPKSIKKYIEHIKNTTEYIKTLQQFVSYLLQQLDGIERMLKERKTAVEQLQNYLKPRKSKNKFKAKTVRSMRMETNGSAEYLKQIGLSIHAAIEMKKRSEILIRHLLSLIGTWSFPGIVTDLLNNS
ncbi:hypothetical protein AVEN_213195-1 [Araneus ventricosus]|uniref:Uncharacterized protein n=1 Tax=Araneus ventricosus TaxID=182803 RepID=A0A4Y2VFK4_ARAVE|nr:hypothetical protein AVEN_213195-1 [Araneus ventricosus]